MLRKAFGRRLRFLRLLENLTQAALAEAVGVTEEHLGNIERGVSVPSFDLICRLASALGTHPHNLFLYTDVDLEGDSDPDETWSGLDWKQYVTRVGHWEYDPEAKSFTASRSLFHILGQSPRPLGRGMASLMELVHPEDRASLDDAWKRFLRGEHTLTHSFRFFRRKKNLRLGLVLGEEEKDEHGQAIMLRGVFLDVTEQKRFESTLLVTKQRMEERVAERTLSLSEALNKLEKEASERKRAEAERERELKLRSLAEAEQRIAAHRLQAYEAALEASQEAFALVDRDHVYLTVNQAFLRERGLTREQVVGRHVSRVVGRETYDSLVRDYLDRCLAGEAVEYSMEREVSGKGLRHLLIRYYPMADDQGRVGRVAAFLTDLTDRTMAEKRYRLVAEHSSDLIWILDAEQRLLYQSPSFERILGFHFEPGSRVQDSFDHFPPESARYVESSIRKRLDSIAAGNPDHEPYRLEYEILHKNGSPILIESLVTPVFDDEDRYQGEVGVSRDMTEREAERRALAKSEQRYRHLFENMDQGVLYQDSDGKIITANPAAERILGMPLEEMLGRNASDPRWQAVREDGSPFPGEEFPITVALRTGEKVSGTVMGVYNHAQGERRWLRVSGAPGNKDEHGETLQAFASFEDITDLKSTKENLRKSEALLGSMFDNMATGVAVYRPVDDGRDFEFLRFNTAAENITRIKAREAVGNRLLDKFPNMDRSPLVAALRRVWRTGRTEHLEPFHYKDDVREGWRENRIYRLPTGELVAMFDDVTERMQAQEAMEEGREMYRTLFELESDALFLIDNESLNILEANQAAERMFGYSREELLAMRVNQLSAEPEATIDAVAQEASTIPLRLYQPKDGPTLAVEITTSHFVWRGRRTHIAAMRDVTEQHKLAAMRRDVERIMRHELRSPAQAAVTVARLLRAEACIKGELLEVVDQLEAHGNHMLEIMDMHGRLVRLENGSYEIGDHVMELPLLCSQVARDMAGAADQAGVRLHLEDAPQGQILHAKGDLWLIRTALGNLVKNALEASPKGGTVVLRYERENGSCRIEVRNSGDIPGPVRSRLFDKYATHGKHGGQGLGCYLARLAAEAHQGSVAVAETGKGTTRIHLLLPVAD